jgi:hypothetical protein
MLKTASRKAAGKLAPEAYPLGYVEDVGEPRTTREVVFSILLEAPVALRELNPHAFSDRVFPLRSEI